MSVRGLTKTYGQAALAVDAVRPVDLDLVPGRVVLIMEPSGSGKTHPAADARPPGVSGKRSATPRR
ncbi:MAG TPA: hypothetical protein VI248_28045 [Kineosporiaceae bacterium]